MSLVFFKKQKINFFCRFGKKTIEKISYITLELKRNRPTIGFLDLFLTKMVNFIKIEDLPLPRPFDRKILM